MGNIFALLSAHAPTGSFPEGPHFARTDVPDLGDHFPETSAVTDNFKFVKLLNIFPLPYSITAIKGSLSYDSISDTLCNISEAAEPLWGTLI